MKNITFIIFLFIIIFIIPSSALAATLSLTPPLGQTGNTVNRGCDFSVRIDLDTTGTQTDGTDAILRFDPGRFTAKNIVNGTIYPDFPGNNIDAQAGRITVSGLASVSQPFTGKGTLATINFSVLPNAQTTASAITFEFDPNDKAKTTDSNVVERGTVADVLSAVTNGSYTIGTGTVCAAQGATQLPATGLGQGQVVATPSAQIFKQVPLQNTLPPAGSEQLTFTIAIVGAILTILGILGLALL